MHKIINKQTLSDDVKRLNVEAPQIAAKILPGQYVMVTATETGERIPLTPCDSDAKKGLISLVFKETGESTKVLGALHIGEEIYSILGPLGRPMDIKKVGTVICVSTGFGTAQILSVCRALKKKGNKVIGVIGAKGKNEIILEAQIRLACDKIFIKTQDGSFERRGTATDVVKDLLAKEKIDAVYAFGTVSLMQAVSRMTKEKSIQTFVSLNPVMVDGTGMCGSCRVRVAGKLVLACVDGPGFDGHQVDFENLRVRMNSLKEIASCDNRQSTPNPEKNALGTLKRFLLGTPKK